MFTGLKDEIIVIRYHEIKQFHFFILHCLGEIKE